MSQRPHQVALLSEATVERYQIDNDWKNSRQCFSNDQSVCAVQWTHFHFSWEHWALGLYLLLQYMIGRLDNCTNEPPCIVKTSTIHLYSNKNRNTCKGGATFFLSHSQHGQTQTVATGGNATGSKPWHTLCIVIITRGLKVTQIGLPGDIWSSHTVHLSYTGTFHFSGTRSQSLRKLCRGSVGRNTIWSSWLFVYEGFTGETGKTTLSRWKSHIGDASNRYDRLAHVTMNLVTAGYHTDIFTHTSSSTLYHELFQSMR